MGPGRLLQKTCLKQHYSLRRQLLTSFGSVTFITLTLVVIVSIIMLNAAGNLVKERSSKVMKDQIHSSMISTTKTTAETFSKLKENFDGVVQQVVEITMDRISGYPDSGWEDDLFVPFFDIDSQRNVYPLDVDPAPLEWMINRDVTDDNFAFVFPGRSTKWLEQAKLFVSFSTGAFFMQGQCDPTVREPISLAYYPNCTEAHNDVSTGGVVKPTSTAKGLHEKSGDIAILLRPLHEANIDIFFMGVHFFNSGAGATVSYPGVYRNGLNLTYESQGCEWLRTLNNTITGEPLASEEEIARCHPKNSIVRGRDYNPVEREWFREAVTHRNEVYWFGPHKEVGFNESITTVCKAIFDRK